MKRGFLELKQAELESWCESHSQPRFRADQIRRWVFEKRATSFQQMLDLPKSLRELLDGEFVLFRSEVVSHQVARDRTEKLLLKQADRETIECVLMREPDRRTICISTQVGCAMGCVFCASGLMGLKRSLTRGEILEEILLLDRLLEPTERLTNLVVMGIGEPLANLTELLSALDEVTDSSGLGLSPRRITISTVGLPPKMRELAKTGKPFNLAVSLHAPVNDLRSQLVPVNERIGIDAVLAAADEYFEISGRRVTYEYVLLSGVNDLPEHALELGRLLEHRQAHVNLIPMNNVEILPYVEPTAPRTAEFVRLLESRGVVATVRKRKGADIDAACGQLRLKSEQLPHELPLA